MDHKKFDLGLFFPPCTYLCVSGARWFKERQKEQKEALKFIKFLMNLPISKIAQIIQPYQFGHGETKATCLWLKNLPKLIPTKIMNERKQVIHLMPPGKNRSRNRSRTYLGVARAMANQW